MTKEKETLLPERTQQHTVPVTRNELLHDGMGEFEKEGVPHMTVREILKTLHRDGWQEIENRTTGSHIQLRHSTKPGKVTVPSHGGDIAKGTLNSIMKQAGLK